MPSNLPIQSPEVLKAARELANRTRSERASIKARLRSGDISLASVFDLGAMGTGDKIVGRLQVGQAVRSIYGWGPKRTSDLLAALDVAPATHLDRTPRAKLDKILAAVQPAE